jgi:predicted TIM-barrel fold metal-dependent hydrolase
MKVPKHDNHVHIGQFNEVYYDPLEIVGIVLESGMESLSFSSTTSCCDNIMYWEVENEIKRLLTQVGWNTDVVRPYFWYIPDYINQRACVEWFFDNIPYKGIKLHPLSHNWEFDYPHHFEALLELFEYADDNHLPVLIHTGNNDVDRPDRFERFFCGFNYVKFILAHCRPLSTTIKMLRKYKNIYCDTAFVLDEDIEKIIQAGYKDRIVFGTDFPVTHYFKTKYQKPGENIPLTLREQYVIDSNNYFRRQGLWKKI